MAIIRNSFFSIVLLAFGLFSMNSYSQDTTWYTLASGDWDDPTVWTLDPSGSLPKNPDNLTPSTAVTGTTHKVVILSGRTIDVYSDGKTNASLTVYGRIDLHATSGHTFTLIRGNGKIILKDDNFPSGDATHFITAGQGEGTVIFDSTGYDLTTPHTFFDVEVDLDNPTDVITLLADYQVNGDLILTQGEFRINDNSSTALLDLAVNGNVNVAANASISVGTANAYDGGQNYYNRFHDFTVGGDFVSYGTIRLTNQTVPDYLNQTTTGGVTLHFTSASDNYFKLYNTTDLYNLHINKGTDATYELSLYAHNKAYFALFGPNSNSYTRTVAHPQHDKAFWIEAGSVRLKGEVVIPSLVEGGSDWSIGGNASLILDGENVEVYTTTTTSFSWTGFSHAQPNNIANGSGSQGASIYGDLTVENGYFSSSNSAGIIYRPESAGSVNISGGEVNITQLRLTGSAASGYYSFIQTGGVFRVRGNGGVASGAALFSLNDADMYFSMTGGQLIVDAVSSNVPGAIDIQCAEGNYNVTGGEVICNWGSTSEVLSLPNLYNLSITNGTTVDLDTTLKIANDLSVDGTSALLASGQDLYIGHDLLFADGASFTHGNNTTYFYGGQSSDIDIENSSDIPAITFFNLVINKDQRYNPTLFWDLGIDNVSGRSQATADEIILIENDLTITRGQFTIQRYTVALQGDLSITDGKLLYNSSLPGRLSLEGASQQTITGSEIYSPEFGHIDLNNANGATIATNVDLTLFTLTQGIMDINEFKFSLDTNIVIDGTGGGFSTTKMIMTQGLAGDRGLEYSFNLTASTTTGTIATYPIGVTAKYTPVDVILENTLGASYSGTYRIAPVDAIHPAALIPTTFWCNEYYWKSYITGDLDNVPANDISVNFTDPYSSYGAGKREYYLLDNDWERLDGASSPTLSFENIGFLKSDYTAARNLAFNVSWVFYSKQSGDWTDRDTWSLVGHDGTDRPSDYPRYLDVVYIGGDAIDGEHVVTIDGNNIECANLTIWSGDASLAGEPTLDAGTRTGLAFDEVSGGGRFRISYNNNIPAGNWDNFMYNDTAIFEYYGGAYTIPTDFSVYPNLEATGSGTTKTIPSQDILVRKNLLIDTETLLLSDGFDLNVNDSLIIDNAGVMQFPTNADPCVVTIGESVDLSGNTSANTIEIATGGSNTGNHSLYISDDVILNANSVIDLYDASNNAVDLYFNGDDNSEVNDAGATINLNRLIINKNVSTADVDFLEAFSLSGPTNGASSEKALYLLNGDLTINNSGTDIYLTSGGGEFNIPSTTSLRVSNATVRASGNNTGIYLDGLMRIGYGSQWLLNEGSNNYIEYSSSGSAEISIYQGTLRVGSQIRRNTITDDGILTFSQNHSNSTVIIGETDAPENRRGLLEILNAGSNFTQVDNANITIVQAQATPAAPTLYLDPASSSLGTGSTITFGNASTPVGQDMGIYSTIDLQNVIVDNSSNNDPTVSEWVLPLSINEDLTIQSNAEFDANSLDLTLRGDFYNYGTFTPNNNTTYFDGSGNQRIVGNTGFYNLTKSSTGELWLAASNAAITINNNLDIQSGIVRDSSNTITILGDCNMDGTHVHGAQSGDGFYFNGSDEQLLTGDGTFGKISINNSSGVTVPLGNNFTITDTLKLTSGVFGIGKNLLTLTVNAEIEEDNPFSATNMIQTNVSFTDYGVRKYFPSGAKNFIYPIGSGGKYTPVTFDITANTSSTGFLTVKAADEMHPSIQEDSETPEIVDEENVLQYHWVIRSSGITGFQATAYMKYNPGDVLVNSVDYDIYDYITARLLNDGSGSWNKFLDVDKFDEINEWCVFDFGLISGVDDDQISGDYTAGIDDAIPDQVPFYETNTNGTWSTGTIWTPSVTGGPRGAMVRINTGHTVLVPSNYISTYTTEVQGTVNLGTTLGHRFGDVSGSGLIYTEREVIPAGVYDEFFSSAGGTLEFSGSSDYDVLGDHALVNNVTFSGSGLRRLPSNDLTLNGDLRIDGGATLSVDNDNDIDIEIRGDLIRVAGSFDAGIDLANQISFTSALNQNITGTFTNANTLHSLVVNNPNGITVSSGVVDIEGTLYLTNGTITTSSTDTLRIGVTATISPVSGSASSYINGPLTKVMSSGDDFTFPVGKSGGLGLIDVNNITGITGVDTDVSVEYFFSNPNTVGNVTLVGSGVNTVSQSEYWSIDVVGGGQSTVEITLDGSSDVANALSDINDLIIVGWSGTQWEQIGGTYTITGSATSGSISCGSDIDYSSYQYITLGSSVAITLITGSILSSDFDICNGDAASITLSFTGGTAPWTYTLNGTDYAAPSSPHIHNITPAPTTTTIYTLSAVSDVTPTAGNVVGNADVTVTVNALPTPTLSANTGTSICNGQTVIFTAGTGANYDFYLNAASMQSGTASTYTNSTLTNGDEVDVIVTSSDGCSSSLGSVPITMSVEAVPVPVIAGADTSCEGATDTYTAAATGNTFTWSVTTHGSLQTVQGTETMDILWSTLTPVGTLISTETVTVEEDNGTCTGTDTYNVVINRVPQTGPQYHISNTWEN